MACYIFQINESRKLLNFLSWRSEQFYLVKTCWKVLTSLIHIPEFYVLLGVPHHQQMEGWPGCWGVRDLEYLEEMLWGQGSFVLRRGTPFEVYTARYLELWCEDLFSDRAVFLQLNHNHATTMILFYKSTAWIPICFTFPKV